MITNLRKKDDNDFMRDAAMKDIGDGASFIPEEKGA